MNTLISTLIIVGFLLLGVMVAKAVVMKRWMRRVRTMSMAHFESHLWPRLVKRLSLTSEQQAKLLPRIRDTFDKVKAQRVTLRDSQARLRTLLAAPQPDETAITAELETIRGVKRAVSKEFQSLIDSAQTVLTPVQQARIAVMLASASSGRLASTAASSSSSV